MESNAEFNYRTVKQAVQYLGTGTHVNVPTSRRHPSGTIYRARQLVDISHLVEMMLDFPRFAILVNSSDMGRIITYGGAILFASLKLDETGAAVYKPALVVTCASEAARTAKRLRSSFSGELVIYLVGDNIEAEEKGDCLFLLDKSAFFHLLKTINRKDPTTAKIVFVISYGALQESYCTEKVVSVKSLNAIDRERMGLCDDEDTKTNCVNGTQREHLGLTSAERAACFRNSINPEGTDGLMKVSIPDDILDFGPVICESNHVLLFNESPIHKFISALKRDSLILVAARRLVIPSHVFLLRFLRLGIRNLPKLPTFPDDYYLTRLYEDGFDPEISIASTAYAARIGQKRKIDSDYQPLIQIQPSTEEERMAAKLYYTKGTRWWVFSSRLLFLTARQLKFEPALCKDMVDSIVSQLVLQRDESTAF